MTSVGTLNWTGGTMAGTGTTVIAAGTMLNISASGGGWVALQGVLENNGTVNWTGNGIHMSNGTINNNGTWTADSSSTLQAICFSSGMVNAFNNDASGTFTQQGTGTTQFTPWYSNVAFNNAGTVNINQGELDIIGGGTQTGAFSGNAGTTLAFNGDHTFTAAAPINGNVNLLIEGGTTDYPGAIDTSGSLTFQGGSFTMDGPVTAGSLNVAGGTAILNGTTTIGDGTISGGTLCGAGNVTFAGTLNWTGGTMAGTGTTVIAAGGTLNIPASTSTAVYLQGVLENDGTVNWTGNGIHMSNGTINNNGTWTANSSSTLQAICFSSGTVNAFNNDASGTFTQQGTGTTQFTPWYSNVAFNNAGTVNINQGELDIIGGGTQTGAFSGNAGTTLAFNGDHTFTAAAPINGNVNLLIEGGTTDYPGAIDTSGSLTFQGGSFTMDGPVTAGSLNVAGGTAILNGTTTIGDGTISGGTLCGAGNVTFAGTLNWTGGTMAGTGTTVIAAGGTLNIPASTSTAVYLQGVLENDGTVNWTGNGIHMSNGTINNNGTWTADSSSTLQAICFSSGMVNAFNNDASGTFTQQGTGTTQFTPWYSNVAFNNAGTVNINQGELDIIGGGTQTGAFIGAGILAFSGATVNLATDYSIVVAVLSLSSSTINGPGMLTIAAGSTLAVNSSMINAPLVNEGLLVNYATSTINGSFSNAAGATLELAGQTGWNLYIPSNLTFANGLTNQGVIELVGGTSDELVVSRGTLVNKLGGTIHFVPGNNGDTLTAELDNEGTLQVDCALTIAMDSAQDSNSGTINVSGGNLTINQSGTDPSLSNTGTINVSGGNVTIDQPGTGSSFKNAGTITIGAGQTLAVNGGEFGQQAGMVSGAGTLAFSGATANLATDFSIVVEALSLSASTIDGPGMLTNTAGSTLVVNSSTINAPLVNEGLLVNYGSSAINGSFSNAAGATLQLVGYYTVIVWSTYYYPSDLTLASGFTNQGVIELVGGNNYSDVLTVSSGTLVNGAGGTIHSVPGTGSDTLAAELDNEGTLQVDCALTIAMDSAQDSNSGTINVSGGNLTINQSGTDPSLSNTGTINVSGGNVTIDQPGTGSSFKNAGTITIGAGQTLAVNGGEFGQQAGMVSGAGTLAFSARRRTWLRISQLWWRRCRCPLQPSMVQAC